ncbi:MAG TPA: carboxypeptidase-like regulatory domain-containing protein, partial [Candidatus Binatus sp.]|nr:carboxypeptidase-like regulatory domain-containing protein [Candidatus Binatus sp.]
MRAYVRSIALAAASLSIATLPCLAQQSTALASAADQDSQLAAVAGTVVNASTGEPLKKAQVVMNEEIHDEHPLYAITDAAGHFSIARISPGRYNLEVRRAGYLTARYGQG